MFLTVRASFNVVEMNVPPIWAYFLLSCLVGSTLAAYVVRVERFIFDPVDRETIPSQSAIIEQVGNRSYLSGHLYLNKPIDKVRALTSLEISRTNMPRVRLFVANLDLCSFLNNDYKSKFLQQLHNRFVNFVDVKPRCPMQPHVNYTLRRSFMDESILPELLPECSYFLKIDFRMKSKLLAKFLLAGKICPVSNRKDAPKHKA